MGPRSARWGGAVDIRKADTLHRVQVVEIAPELLEAMGGGQRCRFVAEVVLAEFAGIVAQVEQELAVPGCPATANW